MIANQSQLLTEAEASKNLRISRQTLQRYRLRGDISFIRIGVRVFYRQVDIENYIVMNTHEAAGSVGERAA